MIAANDGILDHRAFTVQNPAPARRPLVPVRRLWTPLARRESRRESRPLLLKVSLLLHLARLHPFAFTVIARVQRPMRPLGVISPHRSPRRVVPSPPLPRVRVRLRVRVLAASFPRRAPSPRLPVVRRRAFASALSHHRVAVPGPSPSRARAHAMSPSRRPRARRPTRPRRRLGARPPRRRASRAPRSDAARRRRRVRRSARDSRRRALTRRSTTR